MELAANSNNLARTGYTFSGWNTHPTGDGVGFAESATYTGNSPLTLYARWLINQYTLTYNVGGNGSITGNSNQVIDYGADGTPVTAVPNSDYLFVRWSDGSTDNPRTDLGITGPLEVSAVFVRSEYRLTYSVEGNGSIFGLTSQTIPYQQDGSPVTAQADAGYVFTSWSDGLTDATGCISSEMSRLI